MKNGIVLIDSGVDTKDFLGNIIGSVEIIITGGMVSVQESHSDAYGHGTAAMHEIIARCPKAEVFSIKILNCEGKTSLAHLIASLKYCNQLDIKIINMSVAINNENIKSSALIELDRLCKDLKGQNKILFSSVRNNSTRSYPAILNSVIGVRGAFFTDKNEYWFNANEDVQCVSDCSPVVVDRNVKNFLFFGGNSRACVNMASKMLDLLERYPAEIETYQLLDSHKRRGVWCDDDIKKTDIGVQKKVTAYDEDAYYQILGILEQINPGCKKDIAWDQDLFSTNIITTSQLSQVLENLEKSFLINIKDKSLEITSLSSISSIYSLVKYEE